MPARTSSAATRRPRARSKRCSGRPTSPSVPDGALYVSDWIDHACRRAPGSGRNNLGSDLPHCPEGVRPESCRPSTRPRCEGLITALRSPAVNVRAIGVRRAQSARRGGGRAGRGAAQRSEPLHPWPRHLSPVSAGPRGPEARRRTRVVHRSGVAHCRLPCDAARRARHHARRRRSSPATPIAGVRREVALSMRDQSAGPVARHPGRIWRAATTGRIAPIWKRWAPAPRRRRRRSTIG